MALITNADFEALDVEAVREFLITQYHAIVDRHQIAIRTLHNPEAQIHSNISALVALVQDFEQFEGWDPAWKLILTCER